MKKIIITFAVAAFALVGTVGMVKATEYVASGVYAQNSWLMKREAKLMNQTARNAYWACWSQMYEAGIPADNIKKFCKVPKLLPKTK